MTDLSLQGTPAAPETIDLYGVLGMFRIANSPYCIRYFSTFANPAGSKGHATLISELKPMRERIDAANLTDLSSLMQRDLNDMRVAHELVPYLKGLRGQVGFFPAILAIMVPKNFLNQPGAQNYPQPNATLENGNITDYQGHWLLEQYTLGPQKIPLGMLKIVRSQTEIVVLDGQHRANAFRFVAGEFDPRGTVYQAFYDGVSKPDTFDADLPITLVWFESEQSIDPRLISRSLFVDVNNNAKRVSAARNILLDDRTVSCVGTQVFYNGAAQRHFNAEHFSLLHSAFDMDSDLASRRALSRFTLSTPEIVEEAIRWALFSTSAYDEVTQWTVGRMHVLKSMAKFAQIFPAVDGYALSEGQDEAVTVRFQDYEYAKTFQARFKENYLPVLNHLFDELDLLKPHYEAGREVAEWIKHEASTTNQDIWRDVFCGGEGLYYSLTAPEEASTQRWASYTRTITEIEQRFSDKRSAVYGANRNVVDNVYQAFVSKAFQVGYVMAVDYLVRKSLASDWITASADLVSGLNSFNNQNWIAIFDKLRPLLLGSGGIMPRSWPTYRNLLIRMYDHGQRSIFDSASLLGSPDWKACEESLKRAAVNYANVHEDMPEEVEIERLAKSEIERVLVILDACGLKVDWFALDTLSVEGTTFLAQELRRLLP